MIDGEFLQLGIGLVAFVEAVDGARVVARADAGAADIQGHFARREKIVHDGLAFGFGELAEDVAGRVGHRGAEAEDLLARVGGDRARWLRRQLVSAGFQQIDSPGAWR